MFILLYGKSIEIHRYPQSHDSELYKRFKLSCSVALNASTKKMDSEAIYEFSNIIKHNPNSLVTGEDKERLKDCID